MNNQNVDQLIAYFEQRKLAQRAQYRKKCLGLFWLSASLSALLLSYFSWPKYQNAKTLAHTREITQQHIQVLHNNWQDTWDGVFDAPG